MVDIEQAQGAIVRRIVELSATAEEKGLRDLAEALAWLTSPAQPHGGASDVNVLR
jgi:hypothetical protein